MEYDVVVVGCGAAGLAAAVSAAEKGMRVVVLERAPKEHRGGNTRYTEAWMRMDSEEKTSDDFVERLTRFSSGAIPPELVEESAHDYENWSPNLKAYAFTDPELISTFADTAPETLQWLKAHGIRFTQHSPMLLQGGAIRTGPSGGGLAIVESLCAAAEKLGVRFLYETTARDLVIDHLGNVQGVRAWTAARGTFDLLAPAVVLASGGFQGNLEMMTRYVGRNAHLTRPVSPGGIYNKGEGIEMALKAGAASAGQFDMFHGEPVDPRSKRHEALIAVLNYGILVNRSSQRFIDEGADKYEFIYDELSWSIMRQKEGIAYFIHDSRLYDIPRIRVRIKTELEPYRASSPEDLARALDLSPSALKKTLDDFNAACSAGLYDPGRLDGLSTSGLAQPKSNWARAIDLDDLHAYPVMCANTFTCGGLKTTKDAEVLNRDGHPIPGLYAAGETVGLYYGLYVGATSVLRGLVFGRRAGARIASLHTTR